MAGMSNQASNETSSSAPVSRMDRIVMQAAAVVFLVLSIFLFFLPRTFLDGLGLELTSSTDFLARRAAVLLFALFVLSYLAHKASAARQAVLLSMSAATGLMAVLGCVELARGATTAGILKAVALEAALAGFGAGLRGRARADGRGGAGGLRAARPAPRDVARRAWCAWAGAGNSTVERPHLNSPLALPS